MSFRSLNSPPIIAAAGLATLSSLPLLNAWLPSVSLTVLKGLNVSAFALNVIAVSVPGRLDEELADAMRKGTLNPTRNESNEPTEDSHEISNYISSYGRTLIRPSSWAFSIWGPIYLGEAAFVIAQLFASETSFGTLSTVVPSITASFVAANIFQSLWCASFRPSYAKGWRSYISVGMLAGTAYSLSLVNSAGHAAMISASTAIQSQAYVLWPLTIHFGWVSAATLVNLNGSFAADKNASPRTLVTLGYSSAVIATVLGVGLTLVKSIPAYGFTLAWALTACSDGLSKRVPTQDLKEEEIFSNAAKIQKNLCFIGSILCAAAGAHCALY